MLGVLCTVCSLVWVACRMHVDRGGEEEGEREKEREREFSMHRQTFVSRPERPNETRRGGTRRAVAQIRAAPRNLRLSPRETTYRDLTPHTSPRLSPRVKEFPLETDFQ